MSGYQGDGYPIAPVHNGQTVGLPLVAPRVSNIVAHLGDIPAQALGYSGMKVGADAIAKVIAEQGPIDLTDPAAIYEAMKATGINPPAVWNAKRDLGSMAHDTLEYFVKNNEMPFVQEDVKGYVDAGLAWLEANTVGAEILSVEDKLWSVSPFFGCTPDLIFRRPKPLGDIVTAEKWQYVVADWKTGKSVGLKECMQLAFYAHAAMAHGLCPVWPKLIVVQLKPNGKYKELVSPLTSTHVWNAYRSWEAKEQAKREVAA